MLDTANTTLIVLQDNVNPLRQLTVKMFNQNEIEGVITEIVRTPQFDLMLKPPGTTDGVVPFTLRVGDVSTDQLLNTYAHFLQTKYSITIKRFVDGILTPLT